MWHCSVDDWTGLHWALHARTHSGPIHSLPLGAETLLFPNYLGISCSTCDMYRFAILPPLLGVLFSGLVAYFVVHTDSSIFLFLIGDFLYGCSGSSSAMSMSCYTFVADRTPPERRLLRITILQALSFMIYDCFAPVRLQNIVMSTSVCLWPWIGPSLRCCDVLCISGFMHDVMFSYYGTNGEIIEDVMFRRWQYCASLDVRQSLIQFTRM